MLQEVIAEMDVTGFALRFSSRVLQFGSCRCLRFDFELILCLVQAGLDVIFSYASSFAEEPVLPRVCLWRLVGDQLPECVWVYSRVLCSVVKQNEPPRSPCFSVV